MKRLLLLASCMALLVISSCQEKDEFEVLNAQAAKEYLQPLRPGYEGKNPYWNVFAKRFLYAPAFDFKEVEGAKEYRFDLKAPESGEAWSFTADKPWAPLSPVWNEVSVGDIELAVLAMGDKGQVLDTAGKRQFFPRSVQQCCCPVPGSCP